MSFDNLTTRDPFADTGDEEESSSQGIIHIRIQQRNGRKTVTSVQGLPKDLVPKKVLKQLRKDFATNGSVVEDPNFGTVIQVQGDQRAKFSDFLESLGVKKDSIKIHGF